jgi:hypothetical protein
LLKTLMGLAAVAVLAAPASAIAGTKDTKGTQSAPCIDQTTGLEEGTFTYDGVTVAWPPNHKERTAVVTLTDADDEPATDGVTLTVDGTELLGSGNTSPDWMVPATQTGDGSASAPVSFLGERSGTEQDGRTYTFTANGTTDSGLSKCKAVFFTAFVPHDQGNN